MKAEDRSLNSILSTLAPAQADPALWPGFVSGYQAHLMEEPGLDLDPEQVGRQLAAHFMLGRQRVVGRDLVAVTTPEEGARDIVAIPGSTLVQLVSDDLRFLLDTVSMEIRALGWTIRRLEHPQLRVTRAPDGDLTSVGDGDVLESWISMEVYPPLGSSAEKGKQQLSLAVFRALSTVRLVVGDWAEMLQRCGEAAALLTEDSGECRAALDLLTWLMAGNFIFLGYQEYKFVADEFCLVPGTGLGLQSGDPKDSFHAFPVGDRPLAMTKHPRISPVHRPVYLDYVGVREFDANGKMVGERRFLGLLSDSAYAESIEHIPTLAAKARALLQRSGYAPESYGWNAVRRTIANYPRDELFDATLDELAPIVLGAAALRDRPLVRVFLRRDHYRSFVTALVYLPRDRYTTRVRTKIANILLDRLGGESCEHNARVSEAVLARLFFVVKLKSDAPTEVDAEELAAAVEAAAASWDDQVAAGLEDQPAQMRGVEFGEAYQAAYSPDTALDDLRVANELDGDDDVRYAMTCDGDRARFKIFTFLELELHRIIPHLASLGVEVDDEQRFQWQLRDRPVHVYDFGLELGPLWTDSTLARTQFVEAFDASYGGLCEADAFNALVITGLRWQQVAWLRGIARFLKQARVGFSQDYIAQALVANAKLTGRIVEAFEAKFEPGGEGDWEGILAEARAGIDQVASLDQDRILRLFADFITACQRTNAYTGSATLAFKLASQQLAVLPDPKPLAEIFVYSPRVQGVHLRFGPIARGGLRWSDRAEDFRTEVLGLAKAQTVKNTVIVPVGAKGGFVPQRLPADRAQAQAEGLACYRLFIRALLSVTDNIVSGQVVAPVNVRAYDGPDPYLVVAADKGTATFSDEANQISGRLGFWLGDAFASGGSAGYDHKAMGITARGAWESVKRHFAELGVDPHLQDFTCVGIGDMSGDVFGNGMLLSRHTLLVAAFDHRHIFLDPTPDPEEAFNERARLFGIPRSTWADYDESKISVGGGVFSRDAKSIWVSPQARQALSWDGPDVVTPNELISVILRARVDLLWNGGIGTYFKAEHETHADAGDKANDPVRVNGSQVRARCAVEGGNLGWTQAGRVEYAQRGGAINTDFIDNSAGVDTSDYEVNIKILLADAVAAGLLDPAERDELLASMTDEIAVSVLRHNIAQNLALSNAQALAADMAGTHAGWIKALEADGFLDRKLEFLPSGGQIRERMAVGFGLTRPELAVLLAYTKIALKHLVLASELPEDPYLADRLTEYFPAQLRERFAQLLPGHRLAREIITTVAVNRFVDSQGITAFHRLSLETGAGIADVVRAQLAARSIYSVGLAEVLLSRMRELDAALATTLRLELRRMVERATRWLLHNRRAPLDIRAAVAEFAEPVHFLRENLRDILTPAQAQRADARYHKWVAGGAPPELAAQMSVAGYGHFALGIAQVAKRLNLDPAWVGAVHGQVCRVLSLDAMDAQVYALPRKVRWDDMARASVRDELLGAQAELTALAIKEGGVGDPADVVANWIANNPSISERAQMLREIVAEPDLARMSVGLGQIRAILRAE